MRLPVALALLMPAVIAGSSAAGIIDAHAAGAVASYVMSPSPIAAAGSLGASATVAVTLTAEDATSAPVPSAVVYLEFKATRAGGSAFVGAIRLGSNPQMFTTDANGHVAVSYHTPAALPATGHDSIQAVNAINHTATIKAHDDYSYSSVTSYKLKPKPIATTGSLAANAVVSITLTALNSSKAGVAGAVVYLSFVPGAGGGSATVGSTPLTATRQSFTANSSGVITITYRVPSTLPSPGATDTVHADNAPSGSNTVGTDTYTF